MINTKTDPKFACKPLKSQGVIFNNKIYVKLDIRQKWTCKIKNNIYETTRNNIALNLTYEEFYQFFKA